MADLDTRGGCKPPYFIVVGMRDKIARYLVRRFPFGAPYCGLHVHINGSLRLPYLVKLGLERRVKDVKVGCPRLLDGRHP